MCYYHWKFYIMLMYLSLNLDLCSTSAPLIKIGVCGFVCLFLFVFWGVFLVCLVFFIIKSAHLCRHYSILFISLQYRFELQGLNYIKKTALNIKTFWHSCYFWGVLRLSGRNWRWNLLPPLSMGLLCGSGGGTHFIIYCCGEQSRHQMK